jgi:lipopolysaccharide/colanic/teichoic acid biosynthesis glycosyltransferase
VTPEDTAQIGLLDPDPATLSVTVDGGAALAPRRRPARSAPRGAIVAARLDAGLKRAFDVVVAAVVLLLVAPLVAIIALAIKLDSPGPVFYRAARVGYRGRDLAMLKFRKMRDGATGIALTTDDDDRFTRIGPWLAKFKFDEIPQLWHILRGEMSLVGPRPETAGFVDRHPADYEQILSVRPGLIGWSQLAFVEESRILDDDDPLEHYVREILPQKVALDVMYARSRTFLLDLRIVLWAVVAVIARRQVAVHRRDGRINLRRR